MLEDSIQDIDQLYQLFRDMLKEAKIFSFHKKK
jgi:hypothetical protein